MVSTSISEHRLTSTPYASLHTCDCDDDTSPCVSLIERSVSAPILVSDASIADLSRHFKICSPSKSSLPRDTTNSSCSPRDSPRRTRFKSDFPSRCIQVQVPKVDKSGCVEELYFNDLAKKSGASSPRAPCVNEEYQGTPARSVCSATILKIEKEVTKKLCEKIAKDSGGPCSLVDSSTAICDASARAQYYHNKLLSTLQILQNKEETIRVQAESLVVAEARIATLTDRTTDLRKELEKKAKECQKLRQALECCRTEKSDVCVLTERQQEDQSDIVSTLQNNLSVIEELYRECFYETAKQESLIDMLRKSYLDVRLMDKQKADQIGRLQRVINSQKWSLDRCQDIALEVENLKMEISNFLHSSTSTNYDSGMWERSDESLSSAPGAHEDLQDIMILLLRLRDMLVGGCTCGLLEENAKLKKDIEELTATNSCMCGLQDENGRLKAAIDSLDAKVGELRGKLCELECALAASDETNQRYKDDALTKEQELRCIRQQLAALENDTRDQNTTCEAMSLQLKNMQCQLDEKNAELLKVQQENACQEITIKELRGELEKADQLIKENCKIRSEVSYLTSQVSLWRAQLADSERRVHALEDELQRAREQCAHIDAFYREKASTVAELQARLEEAHSRGAALCGETRHAICAVRQWMRRMREKHREQDAIVKEKEALIRQLQRRLDERHSESQRTTSTSDNTASCSKCMSSRDERSVCSKRRVQCRGLNINEMASCSSAPVPPMRLLKKKPCSSKCGAARCKAWCDASMQEPMRRESGTDARRESGADVRPGPYCTSHDVRHVRLCLDRTPRDLSPTEELFRRVEQISEALADGHRRWARSNEQR